MGRGLCCEQVTRVTGRQAGGAWAVGSWGRVLELEWPWEGSASHREGSPWGHTALAPMWQWLQRGSRQGHWSSPLPWQRV